MYISSNSKQPGTNPGPEVFNLQAGAQNTTQPVANPFGGVTATTATKGQNTTQPVANPGGAVTASYMPPDTYEPVASSQNPLLSQDWYKENGPLDQIYMAMNSYADMMGNPYYSGYHKNGHDWYMADQWVNDLANLGALPTGVSFNPDAVDMSGFKPAANLSENAMRSAEEAYRDAMAYQDYYGGILSGLGYEFPQTQDPAPQATPAQTSQPSGVTGLDVLLNALNQNTQQQQPQVLPPVAPPVAAPQNNIADQWQGIYQMDTQNPFASDLQPFWANWRNQ